MTGHMVCKPLVVCMTWMSFCEYPAHGLWTRRVQGAFTCGGWTCATKAALTWAWELTARWATRNDRHTTCHTDTQTGGGEGEPFYMPFQKGVGTERRVAAYLGLGCLCPGGQRRAGREGRRQDHKRAARHTTHGPVSAHLLDPVLSRRDERSCPVPHDMWVLCV